MLVTGWWLLSVLMLPRSLTPDDLKSHLSSAVSHRSFTSPPHPRASPPHHSFSSLLHPLVACECSTTPSLPSRSSPPPRPLFLAITSSASRHVPRVDRRELRRLPHLPVHPAAQAQAEARRPLRQLFHLPPLQPPAERHSSHRSLTRPEGGEGGSALSHHCPRYCSGCYALG